MSQPWPTQPLGELCEFRNGLWEGKKPPYVHVGVIRNTNFTKSGSLDYTDIALLDVEAKQFAKRQLQFGDLILEKSGGGPKQPVGRVVAFEKTEGLFSFSNFTSVIRVASPATLSYRFLHAFLHWQYVSGITEGMQRRSTGIRNLDFAAYKSIQIPLPPLSEQERIVAILDEAFEAIATATANTEKNLANARELLLSSVRHAMLPTGSSFALTTFGEACELYQPKTIAKKDLSDHGDHVVFGANGPIGRYHKFNHEQPQVVVTCRGATCGSVNETPERCWITGNAMVVAPRNNCLDRGYLYWLLRGTDFSAAITGAAQPQITRKSLAPLPLAFPYSIVEQQAIAQRCSQFRDSVQSLESSMQSRRELLTHLKQSILNKAFNGELTAVDRELSDVGV